MFAVNFVVTVWVTKLHFIKSWWRWGRKNMMFTKAGGTWAELCAGPGIE